MFFTVYVANRFIEENTRLISDLLEISKKLKTSSHLVKIDIEKAFDAFDHVIIAALVKFGFKSNFIELIKMFLNEQESCVINGGAATQYFRLKRVSRQGDRISAYPFILCLEILFIVIKNDENIEGVSIFDNRYQYTAYADDSTFFFKIQSRNY